MRQILILGALPKNKQEKEVYEAIIGSCKGNVFDSPIDTSNFKGSDEERYNKAFEKVKKADLIIAEMSSASTGQGMEIREAAILKKELIVVAKEGSKISSMVKGCPIVKEIIYYKNLDDLKRSLEK